MSFPTYNPNNVLVWLQERALYLTEQEEENVELYKSNCQEECVKQPCVVSVYSVYYTDLPFYELNSYTCK